MNQTNTVFGKDEVVVLLGAGASVEANIPASQGMIEKIEELLSDQWSEYRELYFFVKSAIHYADGIGGSFDTASFNVEQLVGTLDDLILGDRHPLYPFVGAWVPKFYEVAGSDMKKVTRFRDAIVRQLRDDWVQLKYTEDADYYRGIERFQQELQETLRVFTLNYDLCVEHAIKNLAIQRGFNDQKKWDWRLFDEDRSRESPQIMLYKLHGSIDWTNDESERLEYFDAISQIDPNKLAIIFGTTYKLQAVDPFLFFAYEFRRWTLEMARLIVSIGYGFADNHINSILKQALKREPNRKLLAVTYIKEDPEKQNMEELQRQRAVAIAEAIDLDSSFVESGQILCWGCGASSFMSEQMNTSALAGLFPEEEDLFDEVPAELVIGEPENVGLLDGHESKDLSKSIVEAADEETSLNGKPASKSKHESKKKNKQKNRAD